MQQGDKNDALDSERNASHTLPNTDNIVLGNAKNKSTHKTRAIYHVDSCNY